MTKYMLLKYLQLKTFKSIFVTLLALNSYGQDTIVNFNCVSLAKDTLPLISDYTQSHLIILSNTNACRDCFRSLNSFDQELKTDIEQKKMKVLAVCRDANSSRNRRLHLLSLKKEIPELLLNKEILFDIYTDTLVYNRTAKTGLFGYYAINKTPAILLYRPNKPTLVFHYEVLIAYFKKEPVFSIQKIIAFQQKWLFTNE